MGGIGTPQMAEHLGGGVSAAHAHQRFAMTDVTRAVEVCASFPAARRIPCACLPVVPVPRIVHSNGHRIAALLKLCEELHQKKSIMTQRFKSEIIIYSSFSLIYLNS